MTQVPARACPSTTNVPEETGTALATCCIPAIGTAIKMLSSNHADKERPSRLMDVLDRVLDKGVVIDAWVSDVGGRDRSSDCGCASGRRVA